MSAFTEQDIADVMWAAARCRRLAKHANPKGEHAERAERLEALARRLRMPALMTPTRPPLVSGSAPIPLLRG